MKYLATFHTHFGALSFQSKLKKRDIAGKMMPVPRFLSSSCGTCVSFEGEFSVELVNEDVECVYSLSEDKYTAVYTEPQT